MESFFVALHRSLGSICDRLDRVKGTASYCKIQEELRKERNTLARPVKGVEPESRSLTGQRELPKAAESSLQV